MYVLQKKIKFKFIVLLDQGILLEQELYPLETDIPII